MGISTALNSALSGLTATSRMAEIVSSNLSNVLTDGYGRRSVELSSVRIGGGVQIDGVTRHADRGILADRRLADAGVAGQERTANAIVRLERDFGMVDDPAGLGGRLAALEQAFINASADPASDQRLGVAVTRLRDVVDTIRQHASNIQTQRQDADGKIADDVNTLNTSLQQVERLNADIQRSRGAGLDLSSLIDARQLAIDKIANLVPLRELDRGNGQVALMTTQGAMLIDGPAATFEFQRTPTITPDMTLGSGALAGLMMNGAPVDILDGVGRLDGGALGATFALRDKTLVEMQAGLDDIAADLVTRFSDPAVDPTLAQGDPGLLSDRGAAFDPANVTGISTRITVNAAVDPTQGGAVWRLRDGIGATAQGAPGQNAQIDRLTSALYKLHAPTGTSPPMSAVARIAAFTSHLGQTRLAAEEKLSFGTARQDTLRSAELATGVDSDRELQMLLRIEQAYAANAKVMQTIDIMMQRLMEI